MFEWKHLSSVPVNVKIERQPSLPTKIGHYRWILNIPLINLRITVHWGHANRGSSVIVAFTWKLGFLLLLCPLMNESPYVSSTLTNPIRRRSHIQSGRKYLIWYVLVHFLPLKVTTIYDISRCKSKVMEKWHWRLFLTSFRHWCLHYFQVHCSSEKCTQLFILL